MKANIIRIGCSLFLLGAMTSATAQSTWNYFITDAGDGNSLVTWTITGDVTALPSSFNILPPSEPPIAVSINAPGIYNDSFSAGGGQAIPTPDGSYFYTGDIYRPVVVYDTVNAAGNGNDSFGLSTPPIVFPGTDVWHYSPGTQSVLIPVVFSNFNPGTYQSVDPGFTTPLTVTLTVATVPEPSTLVLALCAVAGAALKNRRRKND